MSTCYKQAYPHNSILSSYTESEEALYELIGKDLQDVLSKKSKCRTVYIVMQSFGNYRNTGRIPKKLVKVNNCGWEEDGNSINTFIETFQCIHFCVLDFWTIEKTEKEKWSSLGRTWSTVCRDMRERKELRIAPGFLIWEVNVVVVSSGIQEEDWVLTCAWEVLVVPIDECLLLFCCVYVCVYNLCALDMVLEVKHE